MLSILKNFGFARVLNAVAAGTTDQKTTGVDCSDAKNVLFGILFGTLTATATISIKLQGSDTDVDGNYVDLEATAFAVYDDQDNKMALVECVMPQYRYIRAYIDLGTANTVIDGVFAMFGVMQRSVPVTQDSTLGITHYGNKSFISPVAGTA